MQPLIGLEYMELMRNMNLQEDKKTKRLSSTVKSISAKELCNSPTNICSAFAIEAVDFHHKHICKNNELWINDNSESVNVVALSSEEKCFVSHNINYKPLLRYCYSQKYNK